MSQPYPVAPDPGSRRRRRRRRRKWPYIAGGVAALLVVAGIAGHPDTAPGADAAGGARSSSVSDPVGTVGSSRPARSSNDASSRTAAEESTRVSAAAPVRKPPPTPPRTTQPTTVPTAAESGAATSRAAPAALVTLGALQVRPRGSKVGYSRAQFGQAWSDDVSVAGGHNGCDTRNDMLRRDLTSVGIEAGTNGCVVLTGTLLDPYTAQSISFVRGMKTAEEVQIDHVVALSDAWQSGAAALTAEERQNLANDPLNLQATSGKVNDAKGDGDAATWLPPNSGYRCTYVTRQIDVKARYGLWVKPAEHDAMARVLGRCGTAPAVRSSARAAATPAAATPVVPTATDPAPVIQPQTRAYFRNCAAARAAGAAPLYRGQPGYRPQMDGDHDGIACEARH